MARSQLVNARERTFVLPRSLPVLFVVHVWHWEQLNPLGKLVANYKYVLVSSGSPRQATKNVGSDDFERLTRRKEDQLAVSIGLRSFCLLALPALANQILDILPHAVPIKSGGNEGIGLLQASMCHKPVKMNENRVPRLRRRNHAKANIFLGRIHQESTHRMESVLSTRRRDGNVFEHVRVVGILLTQRSIPRRFCEVLNNASIQWVRSLQRQKLGL